MPSAGSASTIAENIKAAAVFPRAVTIPKLWHANVPTAGLHLFRRHMLSNSFILLPESQDTVEFFGQPMRRTTTPLPLGSLTDPRLDVP